MKTRRLANAVLGFILFLGLIPAGDRVLAAEDASLIVDGSALVEGWEDLLVYVPESGWASDNLGDVLNNDFFNAFQADAALEDGEPFQGIYWYNPHDGEIYYNNDTGTISGMSLGYLTENAKSLLDFSYYTPSEKNPVWAFSEFSGQTPVIDGFKFYIMVDGALYESEENDDLYSIPVESDSEIIIYLTLGNIPQSYTNPYLDDDSYFKDETYEISWTDAKNITVKKNCKTNLDAVLYITVHDKNSLLKRITFIPISITDIAYQKTKSYPIDIGTLENTDRVTAVIWDKQCSPMAQLCNYK